MRTAAARPGAGNVAGWILTLVAAQVHQRILGGRGADHDAPVRAAWNDLRTDADGVQHERTLIAGGRQWERKTSTGLGH